MTSDLYTLFKNDTAPQDDLEARVFACIEAAQAKKTRTQKIVWMTTSVIFSLVVVLTGIRAISNIASSNLSDYVSLVFSDTSSALSLWKEISILIIESLPIIAIGLFLGSIYVLFWSAKKYSISSKTLAY